MPYYILRSGQQSGPYAITDLQNQLTQGSILYSDLARTDAMSEWMPLSQLLQTARPAQPLPPAQYAVPPSLHWAWLLVLSIITGLFTMIWVFIQSSFVKKIDPASQATLLYAIALVVTFGSTVIGFGYLVVSAPQLLQVGDNPPDMTVALVVYAIMLLFMLGGSIIFTIGTFKIRDSMVRHYNTVEPINLRMSGAMTFFFNTFYIQYHMSRIAKWKETGFLKPQQ